MTATFFGQYLQIKGVVSAAQLNQALQYQAHHNQSLGQLAQQQGLLNADQCQQLNMQQRSADIFFGQLATHLGWLHESEVEQLLEKQREAHVTLGRALLDTGALTEPQLHTTLADYHYWRSRQMRECSQRVAQSVFATQIGGFTDILERQLARALGVEAHTDYVMSRRPRVLPQWCWQLADEQGQALVAVEPAPSLLLAFELRQNTRLGSGHLYPEDFFDQLMQQLADGLSGQCSIIEPETSRLCGPAQESLCVGYSVQGDPLQVYFCAA